MFPEVTDTFEELLRMSSDVSEDAISSLKRFVVLMNDRTNYIREVKYARKPLFFKSLGL